MPPLGTKKEGSATPDKGKDKDADKDKGKDADKGKDKDADKGKDKGKDADKDSDVDRDKSKDKDKGKDADKGKDKDKGKDIDKDKGKDKGTENSFNVLEVRGDRYRELARKLADAADTETVTLKKAQLEKAKCEALEEARIAFLKLANELEAKAIELAWQGETLPVAENVLLRKSQFVAAACGIDLPGCFDDCDVSQ